MDDNKMPQILVSVRYEGFYLELLINRDATIKNLVQAMKQNGFIPLTLKDQQIKCKTTSNKVLKLNNKVQEIIEKQQNSVHFLEVSSEVVVEQKQQKQVPKIVKQSESAIKSASQTNSILKKIVGYLNEQNTQSLTRAQQNKRIEPAMAALLTQIGFTVNKIKQKATLYHQVSKKILSKENTFNFFNQLFQYVDLFPKKQLNTITKNQISQLKQYIKAKQQNVQKQTKRENDKRENQQKQFKQKVLRVKNQNQLLRNLHRDLEIKHQQDTNLFKNQLAQQRRMSIYKQKQMKDQMNQEKSRFDEKIRVLNKQLQQKNEQNNKMQQQLQQLNKKFKKESQILKLYQYSKHNSINFKNLSQNQKKNLDFEPTISHLLSNHKSQLKQVFQSSMYMKKKIRSVNLLMAQGPYCDGVDFKQLLSDKKSLLFIAKGQNGKVFGAFTQQTLNILPDELCYPDFKGKAFLFSIINDQLTYFQLIENQNSLIFDFHLLVFGNDDLVVNFRNKQCQAKFPIENTLSSFNKSGSNKNNLEKMFFGQKNQTKIKMLDYSVLQVLFQQRQ